METSLLPSPTSHSSTSSSSSNTTNATTLRHLQHHHSLSSPKHQQQQQQQQQNPTPTTPRSEPQNHNNNNNNNNNPYPTTFVQADTTSFKQVVQMLTGSTQQAQAQTQTQSPTHKPTNPIPPIKTTGSKSKLYERRNSLKNNLKISPLLPSTGLFSPRNAAEILSPSILDFPALALSPVTPLIPDPFNRSPATNNHEIINKAAEEKAIAEKGFFLHPSPASTPRDSEPPRLLPLFPVTSPRLSSGSHNPPTS